MKLITREQEERETNYLKIPRKHNGKRQSFTHNARHAVFLADMGETTGTYQSIMQPSAEFNALCAELVGVDTPEMVQNRIACESTAQGNRENSPETYGRTLRQTRQKYLGDVHNYKPSMAGNDCGPELSEVESALVSTMGHTVEVE
jgi:hypothetical protein